MKRLFFSLIVIAIISSCSNDKTDNKPSTTTNKFVDSSHVKIPQLNFEEQLAAKLLLPDTVSMAAYRTTGCFSGTSNLQDSLFVMIDVEAKKVSGFLKKFHGGKTAPDVFFEGKLEHNIITTTRGMESPAKFLISGNKLLYKSVKDSAVLSLDNCK